MTPNEIVTAVIAVIGTLGIRDAVPSLIKHYTGRAEQEKARVRELMAERDQAENERDAEARRRRRLEEALSYHRRLLTERGVLPSELPPWPN